MTIGQGDLDLLGEAIGWNIFDRDGVVFGEESGHDSDGCLDAMFAWLNTAKVSEGFHNADSPVEAGVKARKVVEEDDAGDAGGILGFTETGSDDGIKSPGFVD